MIYTNLNDRMVRYILENHDPPDCVVIAEYMDREDFEISTDQFDSERGHWQSHRTITSDDPEFDEIVDNWFKDLADEDKVNIILDDEGF